MQISFIPENQIWCNIHNKCNLTHKQIKRQKISMITLIDVEEAFDKAQRSFTIKVLEKVGMEKNTRTNLKSAI